MNRTPVISKLVHIACSRDPSVLPADHSVLKETKNGPRRLAGTENDQPTSPIPRAKRETPRPVRWLIESGPVANLPMEPTVVEIIIGNKQHQQIVACKIEEIGGFGMKHEHEFASVENGTTPRW